MNILAWVPAAVVMFGPGIAAAALVTRSRRRHKRLRARIGAYGYLSR